MNNEKIRQNRIVFTQKSLHEIGFNRMLLVPEIILISVVC